MTDPPSVDRPFGQADRPHIIVPPQTRKAAPNRLFYRKEKLRGACWEYPIEGGWITVPSGGGVRDVLHHHFQFYRPREIEVRTAAGIQRLERAAAEQWFFTDRWFSLLRFTTGDNRTIGYYVNFSRPLREIRKDYYQDLDLELDLWLDPDGTATELDRDEFDIEIAEHRLSPAWADAVAEACETVRAAVSAAIAEDGPDLDHDRDPSHGLPRFILRV